MNATLLRVGLRYIRRHRLQSLLLVLGVALGVAVIVAIDLANSSASRAFQLSTESITGKATQQIIGGPNGFDDSIYRKLRVDLGIRNSAPVVENYVTAVELDSRPMQLLGIDPFAEAPFRNYLGGSNENLPVETLTAFLVEPNTVLISEDVARQAGLSPGSALTLKYGTRTTTVRIAGLLKPSDEASRRALSGLLIADISTAQEILNQVGKLDRIDLIVDPSTPTGEETLNRIRAILPPGVRIERSEARSASIEQMSSAFELNLSALSLLALVVGMFLIYNTITFSVVQRRPVLGTLRAIGVTRSQIFGMVVGESLVLGAIGAVLGTGLGIILGQGAVRLVTRTINDLYFTVTVTDVSIAPSSLIKGAVLGILAAAIAAAIPAWEATRVPPAGTLRRSDLESRIARAVPWVSIAGLVVAGIGWLLLLIPTRRIDVSFGGLFAIVIGAALLVPLGTIILMRVFTPFASLFAGIIGRIAPRSIIRSLSRTAVAIAALMVAVSVIVGVSIMIGSFRQTVVDWLDTTLTADIFISAPSSGTGRNQGFDPTVAQEIKAIPGVERISTARTIKLETPKYGQITLAAFSTDIASNRRFVWVEGNPEAAWQHIAQGEVFVSEPFAYRNNIPGAPGTTIELPTDKGLHQFTVAGIYYDYASDQGTVLMADPVYRSFWDDGQVSSVAAFVAPGYDVDSVIQKIQGGFAGKQNLVVQSNRGLRQSALTIFDRTFAITTALQMLAGIVSFIGVLSTLMALQLERMREIGVMRANGMTITQVWRMILLETGLMGLTAGILALPVGTLLALVLVYVINLRSFGWTLQFLPRPDYFLQALAVALAAALLAGIYPALRIGQIEPATAMRTE